MKKIYIASLIAGITLTLVGIMTVNANQAQFTGGDKIGTSLTVPQYMLAGKSTSTLDYYSATYQSKLDRAVVQVQVTSTTSQPVLVFRLETSNDNTNWYSYNATSTTGLLAGGTYTHTFSTTTHDVYNAAGNSTKQNFSFEVPAPGIYNRLVLTSPVGNSGYNIFAEIFPSKEIK